MVTDPAKVNSGLHGEASPGEEGGARRDAVRTRAKILAAAQKVFSEQGYAHAGMRDVAREAGVNVALVARYFGPKEKLFEAALDANLARDDFWLRPRDDFGRSLVAAFFDSETHWPNPLPMLMQASTDPVAQAVALNLLKRRLEKPLADWLGPPDAEARAAQILALTAGVFLYRIMLPLEPFSGPLQPAARRWLEGSLQQIVDGA